MQWWAWIAVGAILLGSELAFVDAQFYLVFVGASRLRRGDAAARRDWTLPDGFSGCYSRPWPRRSVVTFRRRIYEKMRRTLPAVKGGPAGETMTLPAVLPPGETCRLEYRGCSWSAINGGKAAIRRRCARARIDRVDGLDADRARIIKLRRVSWTFPSATHSS